MNAPLKGDPRGYFRKDAVKPLSNPKERSVGEQQVLKEWKEDVQAICQDT